MQHTSRFRPFAAVAALFLLTAPVKGHAQYAFNYAPAREVVAEADPEVGKAPASGATKLIHGVIQNEQGVLPGATVWLKGSRTIVVTNAEGAFELQVPANAKSVKLVCGYGGLQEEELTLTPVQAMGSIYLLQTKHTANK
ncbi:carboxypeptidase-like regulatory domain-containing protein [Hymenobacter properus]|uniref:Carboxypeptidase-like regulatory domain-containing protein n=1 Tax=Hymenobacter properus TaxID=2791026 RepID=A0A931FN59_9BACT|nr:carboxypeptidase-like regulatory domain-containing protein [Hymenobacter properus]MBF9143776.1 carboxypeptidase-like regulatory domain-containing protein [Hymenobacter properus]MBR7722589.1 carboxypeptidase-like regulatory domain-containing protein [Microvirga sp. SRT04]